MRKSWTDERLDDFRVDVDRRFDDVDKRFDKVDKRFDKVDRELTRVNDRLDDLYRAVFYGVIALTSAMLAGFAGMITLVATQT